MTMGGSCGAGFPLPSIFDALLDLLRQPTAGATTPTTSAPSSHPRAHRFTKSMKELCTRLVPLDVHRRDLLRQSRPLLDHGLQRTRGGAFALGLVGQRRPIALRVLEQRRAQRRELRLEARDRGLELG